MKSLFTTLLIASYIGVAVFGAYGMHTQAENLQGHQGIVTSASSNCMASIAKGTDCPKETDPIDFASFHIDVFRSFSLATFGENLLASLLLLVFLFIGVGLNALFGKYAPPDLYVAYSRYGLEQYSSPPRQQILRWLALHENSPASP